MFGGAVLDYQMENFYEQISIQNNNNLNHFEWQSRLLQKFKEPQHNEKLHLVDKLCNKQQVQIFLDDLQCPICYELVSEPQSCQSCEQSFCTLCIKKWENYNYYHNCPCCRESFYKVKPSKYLKILLNKLIFSCINEERGCDKQSLYSDLKKHQKYCDYQIQSCPNQGCSEEFIQKDEVKHQVQCPYENVECKDCQKYFKRKDLDIHQESCNSLFICQFCNLKILQDEQNIHFQKCEEENNLKNNSIVEKSEQLDKHIKEQKLIEQSKRQNGYNKNNKQNQL